MTTVGEAFVNIRPDTSGFITSLKNTFKGFNKDFSDLGSSSGESFADGFFRDTNGRLRDAGGRFVDDPSLPKAFSAVGGNSGESFIRSFSNRISLGLIPAAREAAGSFNNTFERALKRFDIEPIRLPTLTIAGADVVSSSLLSLTQLFVQLGAGAAGIVSQVSSAVSSIVSLGAAAGRTASLIAAVPAALISFGLIVGTTKLATAGLSDAIEAVASKSQDAAKKLGELPLATRSFALEVAGLKPQLDELRRVAANGLLPGVSQALKDVMTLFPDVRNAVSTTARVLGKLSAEAGRLVAGPLGSGLRIVLVTATQIIEVLAKTVGGLVGVFVNASAAAAPLARVMAGDLANAIQSISSKLNKVVTENGFVKFLEDSYRSLQTLVSISSNLAVSLGTVFLGAISAGDSLFKSIEQSTQALRELTSSAEGQNKIAAFFDRSAKSAKLLASLLSNAFKVIVDIGRAALPAGTRLVEALNRSTMELQRFTGSIVGQTQISDYFNGIVPVVEEFGRLVSDVTRAVINFSRLPGNVELLNQIRTKLLPAFVELFNTLSQTKILSAFIGLLTTLVDVLGKIAQNSQTTVSIIETFNIALDALGAILSNEYVGKFIQYATVLVGVGAALRIVAGLATGLVGALSPLGIAIGIALINVDNLSGVLANVQDRFSSVSKEFSKGFRTPQGDDNAVNVSFWERLGRRIRDIGLDVRSTFEDMSEFISDSGGLAGAVNQLTARLRGILLSELNLGPTISEAIDQTVTRIGVALEGLANVFTGSPQQGKAQIASALGLDSVAVADVLDRLAAIKLGLGQLFDGNFGGASINIASALGFSPEAQSKIANFSETVKTIIGGLKEAVTDSAFAGGTTIAAALGFDSEEGTKIGKAFAAVKEAVIGTFKAIGDAIKFVGVENPGALLGGIAAALAVIATPAVAGAVTAALGAIVTALGVVATVLTSVPVLVGAVVAALIYAYTHFETFREIVNTTFSIIRDVVGEVVGFLVVKFAEILVFVQEIWPQIQEAITHVINVIVDIIKIALGVIVAVWNVLGDDILRIVQAAFSTIKEVISAALEIIMNVIRLGLAVINGDWGKAWDALKGIVGGVWDAIFGVVRGALKILVGILGGAYDLIKTAITGSISAITDTFKDAGTWLLEAGQKIIQGLIDGITSMIEPVGKAVGKIGEKIGGFFPGSPVKEGPLSGRHEPRLLGQAVGAAVAEGLGSTQSVVAAALANLLGVPAIDDLEMAGINAASIGTQATIKQYNLTLAADYTTVADPEENFRRMEMLGLPL